MPADEYKVVCFGEILWDILPDREVPGGAPMNVAYHLHQLGERPALITRLGADERGTALKNLLQQKNIDTAYIQQEYTIPTGIVHASAEANGDMKYEIVSPAAWDYIAADTRTLSLVRQADYFIFGSLITRNKTSRDSLFELLGAAQHKVFDVNLRAPFYDQPGIEELLHAADMVKMNSAELDIISGWYDAQGSLEEKISFLIERFGLSSLIVTRGAEGAVVYYEGEIYQRAGIAVKVADTIGSGDAFLAGFLHRLLQGETPDQALVFAGALGALVASRTGGWPEYTVAEVNALATR